MILGIGNDLVDIRRIEGIIQRQGQKFIDRIFTKSEQNRANSRAHPMASYAKMFAAKEAFIKALGTGLAKGVTWHNAEITRNPWGPPTINVTGAALDYLMLKTASFKIHLTMSDEFPYAQAFVIIEK